MNYLDGLKGNSGYSVEYLGEEIKGDKSVVKTMLTTSSATKKKPVTIGVDYKMTLSEGSWQVVDVITDEDSLVELRPRLAPKVTLALVVLVLTAIFVWLVQGGRS